MLLFLPISSMIKLLPAFRYGNSKYTVYKSIQVHRVFYMESTCSSPFGPLYLNTNLAYKKCGFQQPVHLSCLFSLHCKQHTTAQTLQFDIYSLLEC